MAIVSLQINHFRNLVSVQLQPGPGLNLIVGPNGSGKTSLLEAIYCLATGKSFRTPQLNRTIQHGASAFSIVARLQHEANVYHSVAIKREAGQSLLRLNGNTARPAELAAMLPVALIEPNLHQLIDGPPEHRRRFIDWGVFHVEPGFNRTWNRFQRLLKQRNAALKGGRSRQDLAHWDREFVSAAQQLHDARNAYLSGFTASLQAYAQWFPLLQGIELDYQPGWSQERSLAEALELSTASDLERGFTQLGPHRADVRILSESHAVRDSLSRGQQKILAASLILAQGGFLRRHAKPAIILVDDLAAELDASHRERLISALVASGAQVFVTATDAVMIDALSHPPPLRLFHVEHGTVQDCGAGGDTVARN